MMGFMKFDAMSKGLLRKTRPPVIADTTSVCAKFLECHSLDKTCIAKDPAEFNRRANARVMYKINMGRCVGSGHMMYWLVFRIINDAIRVKILVGPNVFYFSKTQIK